MAISIQKISLFAALALSPRAASAGECPAGAAPFPSDMANSGVQQYANLFDISYYDTYKVIHYSDTLGTYKSTHPTKANERIPDIVLWQCGTTKPSFENGSTGIDDASARYFEIPIQKATLPSGVPLPQFELLSVTESIYAMDFSYISSACAQLMEVCLPSLHVTASDENYSMIAAVEPGSVVFTDSFGSGYSNTVWDVEYQSSVDPAVLNRAEWTNFVAAFFNLEAQSNEIFSKIEADYLAMKSLGSQLILDSDTEWGGRQPQVIFVRSNGVATCAGANDCVDDDGDTILGWTQDDNDAWCNCGGYEIFTSHFKTNLVEDAGGTLVALPQTSPDGCVTVANTDGSTTMKCGGEDGLTSFKAFLAEADVIVDETYVWGYDTASYDFAASFSVTAQEVPAMARIPINIFRVDGTVSDSRAGNVGSAWFDWAQAEPQQLLAGMMEMLWGDSFESPCGLKYFRRAVPGVGQEQVGHDDCPYFDENGTHDCAAIHDHLHEVLSCMPPTPSPSDEDDVSSATARGIWAAAAASMSGLAAAA